MNRMQEKVREFYHHIVGGPTSPAEPALRDAKLRARLVLEEAIETAIGFLGGREGVQVTRDMIDEVARKLVSSDKLKTDEDGEVVGGCEPDLVEAVDGLCDLLYVTLGGFEAVGVDAEPYFDLVHAANMRKTPAAIDAHGKRGGKPDDWEDPKVRIRVQLAADRDRALFGEFWDPLAAAYASPPPRRPGELTAAEAWFYRHAKVEGGE